MPLEFGTAGIRGVVGNTPDKLNEAHAAQIFEAYAKYILDNFKNNKNKFVVIGRDNRIKGKEFAILAVNILTSYGIQVYFNNEMVATPFISFLIKQKKAVGGINITASHNPKEYNGIKIYNNFGYQMLPDEIKNLKKYFGNYDKYISYIDKKIELKNNKLINNILDKDIDCYIKEVLSLNQQSVDLSNIKIVYSSLHGTGYQYVKKVFENLKADIIYEPNEIHEDSNFSYVENPNPEYKIAFKNTINLSKKTNADLIIITDPDSDRVGVAYKQNNEFKLINGNENAILITDFLINNKKMTSNNIYYLVYSFVSTSLPAKMCKLNNIKSYVTETGFKWIGKKINNNKKEKFFFAFEESYGSLVNEKISLDKDAIQSVLMIAMIASLAKKNHMNLGHKLEKIYEQYGFMKAKSFSYDLNSLDQLKNIQTKFRSINFKGASFYDYSKGIKEIEPNDMISYEFDEFNWVSLRPSGTEPKFKIYIHVVDKTKEKVQVKFDNLLKIILDKLNII